VNDKSLRLPSLSLLILILISSEESICCEILGGITFCAAKKSAPQVTAISALFTGSRQIKEKRETEEQKIPSDE
jgi:hypothetical protein